MIQKLMLVCYITQKIKLFFCFKTEGTIPFISDLNRFLLGRKTRDNFNSHNSNIIIKSVKVLASQLASKLPTRKTRFRVRSLAAQSPSNTLELPIIFLAVGLDCILCSIFCFATV